SHGRRFRLRPQPLQPRDPGAAAARLQLQTVRLLGCPRERLQDDDIARRLCGRFPLARDRWPTLFPARLRRSIPGPDHPALGADEIEIKRLLQATAGRVRCNICASTSRTLLLLLYASGLRISEALNLNLGDVDLEEGLLHIRETKFYKTRLAPTGMDLTQVLREDEVLRCKPSPSGPDAPFLLTGRGKRPSRAGAEEAFKQIREQAGVRRVDGARYQPRLHDLRHAFAQ